MEKIDIESMNDKKCSAMDTTDDSESFTIESQNDRKPSNLNVSVSNSHVGRRNNSVNVDNEVDVVLVMGQRLSVAVATIVAVAPHMDQRSTFATGNSYIAVGTDIENNSEVTKTNNDSSPQEIEQLVQVKVCTICHADLFYLDKHEGGELCVMKECNHYCHKRCFLE